MRVPPYIPQPQDPRAELIVPDINFLGSVNLPFVIALLTVSYQSIKTAVLNPVDSLRRK